MLMKSVSEASIIMALKRLETELKPQIQYKNIFKSHPEMIVRSNLFEITLADSESLTKKIVKIFEMYASQQRYFFAMTEGVTETTIIASHDLHNKIMDIVQEEKVIVELTNLSSITIRLPKESIPTPGIFYFFLKSLAWEAINVVEIISTHLEFTIILEHKEINRAF